MLHRDGTFRHEGQPIRNHKLRALFERSVTFVPSEGKYVVWAGRFRGEIEVEEAAFFVRRVDLETGRVGLSDQSEESLVADALSWSALDPDTLMCRVKHELCPGGLPARFSHSAQAELLLGAEEDDDGVVVRMGGVLLRVPVP